MRKKPNWFLYFLFLPPILSTPIFDPTTPLQDILIPASLPPNTTIYRLRASDPTFDYPLTFTFRHPTPHLRLTSLNCTHLNSLCHANVVLQRPLAPHRIYDFIVDVATKRGSVASLNCSFRTTDVITPVASVFPAAPTLLMVSEGERRNAELGRVVARGSRAGGRGVLLELWGGKEFGLHQHLVNGWDAEGTIILLGALDYEVQTVHHLTIMANDPFTNVETDTRNIAEWHLIIAVIDEQDTPPVFTLAPPTTNLSPGLEIGNVILQIHAEDGDRGNPRRIKYGLLEENSTFASFFRIDEETGELTLARPLDQITTTQPILLTLQAEEIRTNLHEPAAQTSTAQIALIPPETRNHTHPTFASPRYDATLDENAPTGTRLQLTQAEIYVNGGEAVLLELIGDNSTFDITPKATTTSIAFKVHVNQPKLLDYERWHRIGCWIGLRQVGGANYSALARLTVTLNDLNDNAPRFTQDEYTATVVEEAENGRFVVKLEADDVDSEPSNRLRFVSLDGAGSEFFELAPESGVITVRNGAGLDAQTHPLIQLTATVKDENGLGRATTARVTIKLIDINNKAPVFDKANYEFILSPDGSTFTSGAFVHATDADATSPNNLVRYELINSPNSNLVIDATTGEIKVGNRWMGENQATIELTVRAYDGGVPRLSSIAHVRIYAGGGATKKGVFVVPGQNPDLNAIRQTIEALTGGRVIIEMVRPAEGFDFRNFDANVNFARDELKGNSVVLAIITLGRNEQVDFGQIQRMLQPSRSKTPPPVVVNQASSTPSFVWLLLLLILLLVIVALILIACCVCQGCPLYVPPKRRQVTPLKPAQDQSTKSVQVAEWFGRKEAWSPPHSHRRVEAVQVEEAARPPEQRDQLYIREGNTDILRLITRGSDAHGHSSGKEILLRRYIEQQAPPEAGPRHDALLETSLLQQNLLLRHLLWERERDRDLRLETQSLPAGTQTDGRLAERQTRSETEGSDAEAGGAKRRKRRKRRIRTPIVEEESDGEREVAVRQTKTSELRQERAGLQREVLREISASLEKSSSSGNRSRKYFSQDSLDALSEDERIQSGSKFRSENDLRTTTTTIVEVVKPQSRKSSIKSVGKARTRPRYMEWYSKNEKKDKTSTAKPVITKQKGVGKKAPVGSKSVKKVAVDKAERNNNTSREVQAGVSVGVGESNENGGYEQKQVKGPEHPLLQHSEHRFEQPYNKIGRKVGDDDGDSGIAVNKLPIAVKKSVFTIAYDDMHTNQIRTNSRSSQI